MKTHLGCHLSVVRGYEAMGQTALDLGATTFQYFTRNPRGGAAKTIDPGDVARLNALTEAHAFGPLVAHAPYTMNLASKDPDTRAFARATLADDLARLSGLSHVVYNLHPGSHVGQGVETGVAWIVEALRPHLEPDASQIDILLETMAGKGSEIGRSFDELRLIFEALEWPPRLGVCFDTCHVHEAGYDLINDLDGVLEAFDKAIGLTRLRAVHLNDSKNARGACKDRHERIGHGTIGLDPLVRLMRHPALSHLPFCLETPNELDGYRDEIALLRRRVDS